MSDLRLTRPSHTTPTQWVCKHQKDSIEKRMLLSNGALQVLFECFECGARGYGTIGGSNAASEVGVTVWRDGVRSELVDEP